MKGSTMAIHYDISQDPNQATIDERERWRQVSHAWAARLMEGLNDKAQDFKQRLAVAWQAAVYKERSATVRKPLTF